MIKVIDDKGFLNNLVHIKRYSGTQLLKDESVSDHVWGMISIAIPVVSYINEKLKKYYDKNKDITIAPKLVDLKDVIYRISIHDIDESLYCDIPRPFKYYNKDIHEAIKRTSQLLMKDKLGDDLLADINNSKNTNEMDGLLVYLFDLIQAGLKMRNEIILGNSFLKKEINNIVESLTLVLDSTCNNNDIFYNILSDLLISIINEFMNYAK